jgi:hypothetical protein
MKISSRQACLPLLITAILIVYSQVWAQEPIRVFIGNPDCSPFDVPAQGEVRLPLWFETSEFIGGGMLQLAVVDSTWLYWTGLDFYYPWEYSYNILGNVSVLSFLPEGDYLDTLLHVADFRLYIDADSSYYGQSIQAVVAYNILFVDTTGWWSFNVDYCVSPLCIECQTSINDSPQVPGEISCSAYPNPFNSSVTISFALPHDGEAAVTIYDISGRKVRNLFRGGASSGRNRVVWDCTDDSGAPLSSGVYFYILEFGEYRSSSKLVLLK